jgi:hypothetical protein
MQTVKQKDHEFETSLDYTARPCQREKGGGEEKKRREARRREGRHE